MCAFLGVNLIVFVVENGGMGSPDMEEEKHSDEPLREQVMKVLVICIYKYLVC